MRIDQTSGTNHLFDNRAAGFRELVGTGGGRDIDDLIGAMLEFFEGERAIVEGRRHAEAEIDEGLLARAIAVIHGAELQEWSDAIRRRLAENPTERSRVAWRSFARQAAGHVARIVFDAVAIANRAHHFDVEESALRDAL